MATFEANYASLNKQEFFGRLEFMQEQIVRSLDEVNQFESMNGLRGWLKEEQIIELSDNYFDLQDLIDKK